MNVSSLSSASSLSMLQPSSPQAAQDPDGDGDVDPVRSRVSQMASLMSQLQQLSQSDPSAFKQVTAEISQKLKTEAGQATGDRATFLSQLADKFQQASQSGSMSGFQPPQGAQGPQAAGGHHHHHKAQAAQSGYASTAQQGAPQPESVSQIIEDALKSVSGSTAA